MKLNKILPLVFSCLLVAGISSNAVMQSGMTYTGNTAQSVNYSKATTGAVVGGAAGAIMGSKSKKHKTAHAITDAAIGAVVGGAIAHNT
ncbi:glycine zipper domain-containing protein [Pectinatus brassicae]|uniref:Uncharacterized membrane protein YsdA (DUF1294 family) n=1 Tax=Pectinatus brassicae TaxID=862415 RepID=A0A840UN21_9FIRM|nr:glycine zipper domain-containing protein [Pectinatus brassicae]MBB5336088.1 uncharacterized membrane protein YsdA (DUF1294 family) [Pectinatus brassicae]